MSAETCADSVPAIPLGLQGTMDRLETVPGPLPISFVPMRMSHD